MGVQYPRGRCPRQCAGPEGDEPLGEGEADRQARHIDPADPSGQIRTGLASAACCRLRRIRQTQRPARELAFAVARSTPLLPGIPHAPTGQRLLDRTWRLDHAHCRDSGILAVEQSPRRQGSK